MLLKKTWGFFIPIFNDLLELIHHNRETPYFFWLIDMLGVNNFEAKDYIVLSFNNPPTEAVNLYCKSRFFQREFSKKMWSISPVVTQIFVVLTHSHFPQKTAHRVLSKNALANQVIHNSFSLVEWLWICFENYKISLFGSIKHACWFEIQTSICLQWLHRAKFFYLFLWSLHYNKRSSLQLFHNTHRKHLCQNLIFYKYIAGVQRQLVLMKKVLQRWGFPDNYAKFLAKTFLTLN